MNMLLDGAPAPAFAGDPALVGGLAAFEALRTYGGRPFGVDAHLARLEASAGWMGIPWPGAALLAAEIEAVAAEEVAIVVLLTERHRLVRAAPLDRSRVGAPIRLATLRWEASPSLPAWVKHTSRAPWLVAAQRAGVDEVILVSADGSWTETNRATLIAVRDGALHLPPLDGRALLGVTQAAFLALAREAGIRIVEAPLFPADWQELYVVSTLKELAPIVEVDGRVAVGGGAVGAELLRRFRAARGA